MPLEHFPSVSQAYVFLMELFLGMKIIPTSLLPCEMELL